MPEEAFRDMWDTIQHGFPWSGLVKNRRKDGSFYWVMANVTPLIDAGGKVSGYMSVRTQPERSAVEGAEKLYARMREEAKTGRLSLCLQRGAGAGHQRHGATGPTAAPRTARQDGPHHQSGVHPGLLPGRVRG
ncbi:PAS domain-containing protein [Ideonella sp. B508-1]|uniref:PAS domain-containing protein n=1 Tax=Ideonella sp. B508-1 TaxID=137716 RepID=UPI0011D18341|nr:PAS domain-containing protein [Ideonella sp. B508-1]